jgi:hypothetical protein
VSHLPVDFVVAQNVVAPLLVPVFCVSQFTNFNQPYVITWRSDCHHIGAVSQRVRLSVREKTLFVWPGVNTGGHQLCVPSWMSDYLSGLALWVVKRFKGGRECD